MIAGAGGLPPELPPLLAALGAAHPAAARRLAGDWRALSRPWLAAAGAERASRLTPGGYPLECTFRSGSRALSYAAEPGLPAAPPAAKRRFARAFLGRRGAAGLLSHPLLTALAAQPGQRFGCWLGGRPAGGRRAWKLYQEVVGAGAELARAWLLRALPGTRAAGDLLDVVLVGFDGAAIEWYVRLPRPGPAGLHRLLAAAGAAPALPELLDCLALLAGRPRAALPGRLTLGASLRAEPGAAPAVTLFAFAAELFGGNRQARRALLGLAGQIGADFSLYAAASQPLAERDAGANLHGMVGLSPAPAGLICSVGLQPPPVPSV